MLIPLKAEDFDKYIDFAYELALDITKSGYPTYTDGIKTKEDFIARAKKAIERENEEILLFEYNGQVEGWLQSYYLAEDRYISLGVCNVRSHIKTALSEWLACIKNRFHGYHLYLGFPKENIEAIQWLEQNDFTCIEESYNDVLLFSHYSIRPQNKQMVHVTKENFSDFRKLHALYEAGMYWNSDRMYASLELWQIYLCFQNGQAAGAIYWMDEGLTLEIFGIDFKDGIYCSDVFEALLIETLNQSKQKGAQSMIFFNDEKTHPVVLKLGFQLISKYMCYLKQL